MELTIRAATPALLELRLQRYDLLHVNCEGCEFAMYENLAEGDLLGKFSYIQHSFHYYSQPNLQHRYCRYKS